MSGGNNPKISRCSPEHRNKKVGGTIETRALEGPGAPQFDLKVMSESNPTAATEPIMTVEHRIDLRCHSSARSGTVRAVEVRIRRSASAELQMTFRLDGDIRRIRVPSPAVPRIATQLWRHTCFEAFI